MGRYRIRLPPRHERAYASDLARVLGLHSRTVQRWIARGHLRGHRRGRCRSRLTVSMRDFMAMAYSLPPRGIARMVTQGLANPGEKQVGGAWKRPSWWRDPERS